MPPLPISVQWNHYLLSLYHLKLKNKIHFNLLEAVTNGRFNKGPLKKYVMFFGLVAVISTDREPELSLGNFGIPVPGCLKF